MDTSQPIDPSVLFAESVWVRRLALSLVADANAADDLLQDTWLSVLESPPRHGRNPRAWLASVMRNKSREKSRGDGRRREREVGAARKEALPDTLDVLARASMHQELVDVVMSLREPFRTTILLRFFDDEAPRDIAHKLGVPIHTVNSRLQRGLAELREKLDTRRGGDRSAWLAALAPFTRDWAPQVSTGVSPAVGALVMNAKWKIALVLALAFAGVFVMQGELHDERDVAVASSSTLEPPTWEPRARPSPVERLDVLDGTSVRATATVMPNTPPIAEPTPTVATLRGRVLDVLGDPLDGLRIVFVANGGSPSTASGEPSTSTRDRTFFAESDASGSFTMDAPPVAGELVVEEEGFTTVMAGLFQRNASIAPVVVAASARSLAGRVIDTSGALLAGAEVRFALDAAFATRFSHVLDASRERTWTSVAGADGAFELVDAPRAAGSVLRTVLQGFVTDVRAAPDFADRAIDIVLQRAEIRGGRLTGEVRSPDGRTVEGARVSLGAQVLTTDASGAFDFDLARGDGARVIAVKAGYMPAHSQAESSAPHWPSFVRLTLGAEPLALAGRVIDAQGEPVRGVRLWLADPTFFGEVDGMFTHIEHLLARPDEPGAEELASGKRATEAPDLFWSWCQTDELGRFRIDGLYRHEYRLKALDPATLAETTDGPFASGRSDVEIRMPAGVVYDKVSGRVITRDGAPLAGIKVAAARRVFRVEFGGSSTSYGHSGATGVTDTEGRFALEHVARDGVFLAFSGDPILSTSYDLPGSHASDASELGGIEMIVTRRCHMQVELERDVARATSFAVLDEHDERMNLSLIRGDHDYSVPIAKLIDGRSSVLAVGENARVLVLLSGEQEVERMPLALTPGSLNVVRP